jgi:dCTP diphosphatase
LSDDWVATLQDELAEFATSRDWERYHTPRNLAALISSEAGELLALFRWDQDALVENPELVQQELADVFLGVIRFAAVAGIELPVAARRKINMNAAKYPVTETTGPNAPRTDIDRPADT